MFHFSYGGETHPSPLGEVIITDDLIDQIVYKLYGLSEEEIAIVEGKD